MVSRPLLAALLIVFVGCSPSAVEPTAAPSTPADSPVPSASVEPSAPSVPPSLPPVDPTPSGSPPAELIKSGTWRPLDPRSAPAAREDHTWSVDAASGIVYLFGGRDGSIVHGDLWAFDLASDTWTHLDPEGTGPEARFGHEAAWVDGVGLVIWAGQAGPTTFFDDLWAYDPAANAWDRLPNDGDRPVARYGSCSGIGPDGRLWISHGFTSEGSRFSDTRAYDFATGTWSDETPDGRMPVVRCLHACWWTDDGRFALYAGQTNGVRALGDLWTLGEAGAGGTSWTAIDADLPAERHLYAVAKYARGVLIFGGRGLDGEPRRDLFTLEGEGLAARTLETRGSRPAARWGAAFIPDPRRGRLLLFGGTTGDRALADTWELRVD